MTPRMKREKREDCEKIGDFLFTRWSESTMRKGRVLLYHGYATWLLNFGPDADDVLGKKRRAHCSTPSYAQALKLRWNISNAIKRLVETRPLAGACERFL